MFAVLVLVDIGEACADLLGAVERAGRPVGGVDRLGELHVDDLAWSLGGGQLVDLVGEGLCLVLEPPGLRGVVVHRLDDARHDVPALSRIGFVFGGDGVDKGEEALS